MLVIALNLLQIVSCLKDDREEPLTYQQFMDVYRQKETERQSHFRKKKKWSAQSASVQHTVRVCVI